MTEEAIAAATAQVSEDPEIVRVKLNDLRLRIDAGQEVTPEELLQALRLLHGDLRARAAGAIPTKAKKASVSVSIGKIDLKAILAKRVTQANG